MFMILSILVMIITLKQFVATAAEFPNGTDTKLNFYSCNPSNIIQILSIELFDRNGKLMYPIRFEELATVKVKAYNNGNMITKDKIAADFYAFVENNYEKKMWKNIVPEHFQFLLTNIDGCKVIHNCPLLKGDIEETLKIDFSKYAAIFKHINKTVAYQVIIKIYDVKAEGNEEISCQTVQFKFA